MSIEPKGIPRFKNSSNDVIHTENVWQEIGRNIMSQRLVGLWGTKLRGGLRQAVQRTCRKLLKWDKCLLYNETTLEYMLYWLFSSKYIQNKILQLQKVVTPGNNVKINDKSQDNVT